MSYVRYVLSINPVPWRVPPMSVGYRKGGKFVQAGRDQELFAYQEAIRQELESRGAVMLEPPYMLQLWFYRKIEGKEKPADVTNMVKAAEDALQGVVIDNDRNNRDVFGHAPEQGPDAPGVLVIEVFGNHEHFHPNEEIRAEIASLAELDTPTQQKIGGNEWGASVEF